LNNASHTEENEILKLKEVAASSFRLGCIGFGGIAGMMATIEHEMVVRRKWIDHKHFLDVLSASYIVPGPNSVEIVMHCGKERAGRTGLVVAGVCYILPAMLICLVFGYFYKQYSSLPQVQEFIFGLRPATAALVIATVYRLAKTTLISNRILILLCMLVFAGALLGINEVLLILGAGVANYVIYKRKEHAPIFTGLMLTPLFLQSAARYSGEKLFFIFLKIGAVLYGSGYVLFAYMDESLVRHNHWLTRQQLMDAIAVGQITPGPILSSATFAGFLIGGWPGGVIATIAIFLPSFFISFFMHSLLSSARRNQGLRLFLDGLSAASVSVIAVVGMHLLTSSLESWKGALIFSVCLVCNIAFKKFSTVYIILIGSVGGFLLLKL